MKNLGLKVTVLAAFALAAAFLVTAAAKLALDDRLLNGQWLIIMILCPVALYLLTSFTRSKT